MEDKTNYIPPQFFDKLITYTSNNTYESLDSQDVVMMYRITKELALRINEVLRLKKENFDFDYNTCNLGDTKTKKADVATIPKSFLPELKEWLESKPKGYLFKNKQGKLIARQTVWKWLKDAGKALGLKALITPQTETHEKTVTHIFRKSKGKDMIFNDKAPLNIVQGKLRHNNLTTTSEYLKVKLEAVQEWEAQH